MNSVDFPPESSVIGKLSFSSFVKLSVIAAAGILPIVGVVFLVAAVIGFIRASLASTPSQFPPADFIWLILLLKIAAFIASTLLSGVFVGIAGYPFYSWLCHRRGGLVLRGGFWDRS